ncbi:hypothetical protein [Spartinivicinus poritis]|uniref:Uncharacterized protein n=1 Tax=Spartinivicinus poritis TaxID=2994640 RepID=A0ABT5U948_9GAMM|nr:hypothetical protein [Spartinivicinus sp. A2-2]MDE1462906.1 hypothetical protein [Spartinivicinus sp. A2-2]
MDIKVIVALIRVLGVLVSAGVQLFLGSRCEKRKKALDIKAEAYLDFLNSVSEIASSYKHNENRSLEQLQVLNKAKTRVVLIGSDEVVLSLNNFFKVYGNLNSDDANFSFSKIVKSMRKDLSDTDNISIDIVFNSLFSKAKS